VLWRLEHGGFPSAALPTYVAVLIGTNDIGAAVRDACGESTTVTSASHRDVLPFVSQSLSRASLRAF